jgi:hypothetical protein
MTRLRARCRGLPVDPNWTGPGGFAAFLADVGPQPVALAGLKLTHPTLGFVAGNVGWADTRPCRPLTHAGRTTSVAGRAKELGLSASTLRARLHDGWSVEDVLTRRVAQKWPWYWTRPVGAEAGNDLLLE